MRESVHDTVIRFRLNAALVAKIRAVARAQHKTPSEFMRDVLNERTKEPA